MTKLARLIACWTRGDSGASSGFTVIGSPNHNVIGCAMRAQIVAATQSWVDGGNDRSRSLHCFTGRSTATKSQAYRAGGARVPNSREGRPRCPLSQIHHGDVSTVAPCNGKDTARRRFTTKLMDNDDYPSFSVIVDGCPTIPDRPRRPRPRPPALLQSPPTPTGSHTGSPSS